MAPGRGRRRALRLAGSLALAALLLACAEAVVRLTSNVPFLGNSATLFVPARFGAASGNAPDSEQVSFGTTVHLDRDGFRVPGPGYAGPAGRALLLVGDSVAFGPGVEEPETLAGRLRSDPGTWNVLNSAVIGHAVPDHLEVVRTLLAERDDVGHVVLVYCLNDLSAASAVAIDAELAAREAPPATWVDRLRAVGPLARANELLRERSKLYLLVRNAATDPPRLYFEADLALYADEAAVDAGLAPLAEAAGLLRARGVGFHVVVSPYAYQVREPSAESLRPQRLVLGFLARHGIEAADATEAVTEVGEEAFLPYDPMHLSSAGHAALAGVVRGLLPP